MRFTSNFFFAAGAFTLSFAGASRAHAQAPAEVSVSASSSSAASSAPVELGLFGGVLFVPSDSTLRDPGVLVPDYETTAFQVGLRAGVYPVRYAGFELEGMYAPLATSDGESARFFALRGHALVQIPTPGITPFVLGGYGRFFVDSRSLGDDDDRAFHFGGGVKMPMGEHVSVRIDVRDTIIEDSLGDAGHYPDVTFGLSVGFGGSRPVPLPLPVTDTDGDGLDDAADACPAEAGAPPSGCPVRDADGDGIPDETDLCPAVSGIAPDGCPDPDPDKDGVPGAADRCPEEPETVNGFEDTDGCPDEIPEAVKQFTGVIQGIEFDFGETVIRKDSFPTLDAAVRVLKEYPTLRIRITGHTDSVGTREVNLERSAGRAAAVKDYLVQQGIDAERIETVGAGPDSPIADNKTAAGRQKNRRIEFELLK